MARISILFSGRKLEKLESQSRSETPCALEITPNQGMFYEKDDEKRRLKVSNRLEVCLPNETNGVPYSRQRDLTLQLRDWHDGEYFCSLMMLLWMNKSGKAQDDIG